MSIARVENESRWQYKETVPSKQERAFKKRILVVEKNRPLHLHIMSGVVELFGQHGWPQMMPKTTPEILAMKRLVLLAILAITALPLAGCNRGWPRCWGYRGDPCNVCPSYESMPGVMGQEYITPGPAAEVLPGPVQSDPST